MDENLFGLIQKYGVSGPRYTSYPPAPLFSSAFGAAEYERAIRETEERIKTTDLSLYVHVPFCDTLCYFCGCTTTITRNPDYVQTYLRHLKKEISLLTPLLSTQRNVVQMHWGGGTPTYLTPGQIRDLGEYIGNRFTLDPQAEISIEVDPRGLTYDHLQALRGVGFNRISLGVQDFNPRVQEAVNRVQSESVTREVIDWSRKLGFRSLNIDLIYGLPLQTVESFTETLDKIIDI